MWQQVLLKLNAVISGLCAIIYCLYCRRGHCGQILDKLQIFINFGPVDISASHVYYTEVYYWNTCIMYG